MNLFTARARGWRLTLLLALPAALAGCAGTTGPTAATNGAIDTPPACSRDALAYIGTDGSQLRALRVDTCEGALTLIGPVADIAKPRWTVSHPTLPIVYVAVDGSGKDGSVAAYRVDRTSGALAKINESPAGGGGTTHLLLDAPSMTLLAANFSSGSASSLPVRADGGLGEPVSTIKSTGSGPHRRQASPHAHGISVDPSGRFALVADMGADRVFVYPLDRAAHALRPDDAQPPRAFATPPGSGPRRTLFGRDGRFVYVLDELSADVMTLRWDATSGRLTPLRTDPTSSAGFTGAKSVSEIALSRDGRFLYVGDRGESQLVVYRIGAEDGLLTPVQRLAGGGDGLWHFDLDPTGRWLLVANMRSHRVNLFGVDPATGLLRDTGRSVETPSPVSVSFLR